MKKRLSNLLLSTTFPIAISAPLVSAGCGNNADKNSFTKQEEELKKEAVEKLTNYWTSLTLSKLLGIDVQENEIDSLNAKMQSVFEDTNSDYYKKSYEAFKAYAESKIASDKWYFKTKVDEWLKKPAFKEEELNNLDDSFKKLHFRKWIPNEQAFKFLWKVEETKFKVDIDKMLLVQKYFEIKDLKQLKKVDETFRYTANDLKYKLEDYLLAKYVLNKKYIQIWKKNTTDSDKFKWWTEWITSDIIKDVNDFNKFFEKDKDKYNVDQNELLTNNDNDKKLVGYQGLKSVSNDYGLQWSYENLVKFTNQNQLYGYYDVNNNRIINAEKDPSILGTSGIGYNPFKNNSGSDAKFELVYLNQIAPIYAAKEEIPISESKTETKKKEVELLGFQNTPYKDHLPLLKNLLYFKDESLFKTAQKAFAKLDYKIVLNKKSEHYKLLKELLKDLDFVEKEKK